MLINVAQIKYFGSDVVVACDRNCQKAWGINNRPKEQLSDNDDDFAYLADGELGEAPINPGTYEGGDGKPRSPDDFPNKWCVRECERASMMDKNETVVIRRFNERRYNIPSLHKTNGE